MAHPNQLNDVTQASKFLWAGFAIVTLVSQATGTRYTFKVRRAKDNGNGRTPPWFVSLLTGPSNTRDYTYMGTVFDDGAKRLVLTRKSTYKPTSTPVKAFNYLVACLQGQTFGQMEVWHEGRCGRCGHKLTVPESIESGLGPVCAGLAA